MAVHGQKALSLRISTRCKIITFLITSKQNQEKKMKNKEWKALCMAILLCQQCKNSWKNSKKPDDHHQVAGLQRFMQGGLRYRGGHPTVIRLLLGCLLSAQRVELSMPRRTGKTLQIHCHRPRGGTPPRTAGNSQRHPRHLPIQLGQRAQDLPRL